MKKLLAISIASALCLGIASHAFAGANPLVQLALDVTAKSKTRSCATMGTAYPSCSSIHQVGGTFVGVGTIDVVPVVYTFTGITAVGFGVDWASSTTIYSPIWTKCSDLEITHMRATDASFELTWSTCQAPPSGANSGKATGWLRFNSYGLAATLHIKPSDSGSFNTVDCNFAADELHTVHDGFVNGATPGPGVLDPCTAGPTATEATTWSGVKALYR